MDSQFEGSVFRQLDKLKENKKVWTWNELILFEQKMLKTSLYNKNNKKLKKLFSVVTMVARQPF